MSKLATRGHGCFGGHVCWEVADARICPHSPNRPNRSLFCPPPLFLPSPQALAARPWRGGSRRPRLRWATFSGGLWQCLPLALDVSWPTWPRIAKVRATERGRRARGEGAPWMGARAPRPSLDGGSRAAWRSGEHSNVNCKHALCLDSCNVSNSIRCLVTSRSHTIPALACALYSSHMGGLPSRRLPLCHLPQSSAIGRGNCCAASTPFIVALGNDHTHTRLSAAPTSIGAGVVTCIHERPETRVGRSWARRVGVGAHIEAAAASAGCM